MVNPTFRIHETRIIVVKRNNVELNCEQAEQKGEETEA